MVSDYSTTLVIGEQAPVTRIVPIYEQGGVPGSPTVRVTQSRVGRLLAVSLEQFDSVSITNPLGTHLVIPGLLHGVTLPLVTNYFPIPAIVNGHREVVLLSIHPTTGDGEVFSSTPSNNFAFSDLVLLLGSYFTIGL